ncbi:SURF1 family protein [uncultured Deefgea sp.]|uniref:SURF1 family protein n=1 Tax=uncultured Deefgea sp. TaxID=1304914 RepID=UPI0026299E79|nr:SURF1 family protein [uncultured Deefgea sp.]
MSTIFIPDPPAHQLKPNQQILRKRQYAALIFLAGLVLLTLLLGAWQMWRANQKQSLIDQIEVQQALPTLTWSQGVPPAWRVLLLDGEWLNQAEMLLDQRILDGKLGYHLITPFRLKDGSIVMVNRGWWSPGERVLPPIAQEMPRVTIQPWPRFIELGATPIQGRVFQNLDLGRFAAWAHLPMPMAYGVALDAPAGIYPLTVDRPMGVARHLAYALSWWLMSALGAYLWWQFYLAARRGYVSKG